MKISPEELKLRINHFKNGLKRSGIKLTHQRLEIFNEVAESSNHPDVETIYKSVRKRVPTISLDTVYRTLWMLLDMGLISTLGPLREKTRFDANMRLHHHFVCSECGMTYDFYSEEFDQLKIPEEVKAWGKVEKTQVEIMGLCSQCIKRKEKLKKKR
ncbi:MAG TPA: transcriptional repressor [Actinobacteria bacterium]|nr:transcriptional repressor [Actinomycetota bacterium]